MRGARVLRWRLLVAAVILTPLVGLLAVDYHKNAGAPGIWLSAIPPLLAIAAVSELLHLFRAKGFQPAAWAVQAGTLLVVLAGQLPVFGMWAVGSYPAAESLGAFGWPLAALAVAGSLIFLAEMRRFERPGNSAVQVAVGMMVLLYVAVPMNFLIGLRVYQGNRQGMIALISMIAIVKMSDTGAYFCGRWCGRRPMAPILSPKKTIEGGFAALLTAALTAWLFLRLLAPAIFGSAPNDPNLLAVLAYGLIVGVAGMLGDLAESLLKRDLECKDSSRWMPGLGGVLDVLDSLLLAAPAAYLCWALFL